MGAMYCACAGEGVGSFSGWKGLEEEVVAFSGWEELEEGKVFFGGWEVGVLVFSG